MVKHIDIGDADLLNRIRQKEIVLGGNLRLKIYGALHCRSGKKMKRENRVFFYSASEALAKGFRPCGHCMQAEYRKWKMEL
jgi:methylphosphotriester-DNA--protein-cysteine methyltransferase